MQETGETPNILDRLFLLFIFVFFGPIMWLAKKINGSGVGAGPALASFIAATLIVLGVVVTVIATGIGAVVYALY